MRADELKIGSQPPTQVASGRHWEASVRAKQAVADKMKRVANGINVVRKGHRVLRKARLNNIR